MTNITGVDLKILIDLRILFSRFYSFKLLYQEMETCVSYP